MGISAELDLSLQRFLVDQFYPGTETFLRSGKLIAKYDLKDRDWKNVYEVGIVYTPFQDPKTFILSPDIKPSISFHMYSDKSLCLYHRSDFQINQQISLANQIIPWTIEWALFYELWLVNGNVWLGKERAHGS